MASQAPMKPPDGQTFVEASLELSGKSREESRRTGAMDRADEQVEGFFASKYQTSSSPIHRAVWERDFPLDLFLSERPPTSATDAAQAMQQSLDIVRGHL